MTDSVQLYHGELESEHKGIGGIRGDVGDTLME